HSTWAPGEDAETTEASDCGDLQVTLYDRATLPYWAPATVTAVPEVEPELLPFDVTVPLSIVYV
ncbi:hypothetical protein, partial [Peribacillus butanolivorans]|uniref:hypothetical protein n=1 Tax=Peribacillus butanolivorans TaxID=421767 RepID=UPI00159710DC